LKIMQKVAVVAAVATGAVVLAATPALAANDPGGGGGTCGVVVYHGPWTNPYPGGAVRSVEWHYYNCGSTSVRKQVVINNYPDSGCITIQAHGSGSYSWNESDTVVGHYGAYQSTVNC
jgi:hypothetical protein